MMRKCENAKRTRDLGNPPPGGAGRAGNDGGIVGVHVRAANVC